MSANCNAMRTFADQLAQTATVDTITLEPVAGEVFIFLHYVMGARQAGSQLVMDVVETRCGHRFGAESVEDLRRAAAATHTGTLKCPNCQLEVHTIMPMTAMGGVTLPRLPSVAQPPAVFEESLTQALQQPAAVLVAPPPETPAPGAGGAGGAGPSGAGPSGAGPSGAGSSGLVRRISFVPEEEEPAYTPTSPVHRVAEENEPEENAPEENEPEDANDPEGAIYIPASPPQDAPVVEPAPEEAHDLIEFADEEDVDDLLGMLAWGEP